MKRRDEQAMTDTDKKRIRRSEEQLIQDLESKIAEIKARAERKKLKRDPAVRHVVAAVRSIDKALAETQDRALRTELDGARASLSACLALNGVAPKGGSGVLTPRPRRTVEDGTLLEHVHKHPGQRGEQIAAALGTDTKSMRPVMRRLIDDRKVKTRGERRGMVYLPA